MENVDVFAVRDLRQRTGELIRRAEEGRMSLITKHGRPTILALPFDERLLEFGVYGALAVRLFEQGLVSLSQAAKISKRPIRDFLELLRDSGVAAVDYPPEELDEEMEIAPPDR